MVKILFFIDELNGGGAEKVLRTLANHLDPNVFSVTVQTLNAADPTGLLAPHIRYKAINRGRTNWGKKLFHDWIRLCAQMKWLYPLYIKDDYDIEVAYLECGPTKIIAGSTNKKALKLAWVHCDLLKKEGLAAQAEKLRAQYAPYDRVVCVSETVKDSFAKLMGTKPEAVVLYNVNDEEEIRKKAGAVPVAPVAVPRLVSLGRLTDEKGYDRLIDACARLKAEGVTFCLQILGEGGKRQELESAITAYDLGSQIQLLGFQENPYPYLKAADVVVCSSRYEGFSTVVTEALILGKCVVTTDCAGMDELLGDSEFGLITENSTQGIYEGLKKVLDDPALRRDYEEKAKVRGEQFSKAKAVAATQEFFCRCLEEKRR